MESHWVQISSETKIHTVVTRPSTEVRGVAKPALLFIHYWGGSSMTWHKLTAPSSPNKLSTEYPTISLDLRGWGQSAGPEEDNDHSSYSICAMASDVVSVFKYLKTNASIQSIFQGGIVIIGHSMGAKVAVASACFLQMDRNQDIKGLVLVAPAPPGALHLPEEMKEQQKRAYISTESVTWTVENVLSDKDNLAADDMERIVFDSLRGNALAREAWPTYGMLEDFSHCLIELSTLPDKKPLPILVMVGEMDIVEPKERVESEVVQALQHRGLQVDMVVVPGVKHLIPLESPQSISREISKRF